MNKIRCLVSWVLTCFFLVCFEVNGEDIDIAHYDDYLGDLGVIVVTPTKTPLKMRDLSTSVSVITKEEIEKSGAQHIGEVINNAVGVTEVTKRGTLGARSNIRLRSGGDTSSQVLVMIDGRPVNESYVGAADLSEIPIDNVERIEITRGPSSALYGPNALGGVVNIITKEAKAEKPVCDIYSSFGNFNTRIYRVNFGVKREKIDSFFSGSKNISDGWRDNSKCNNNNFSLRLGYDTGNIGKITFKGGYFKQELGLPGKICEYDYIEKEWFSYSEDYRYASTPDASLNDEKEYATLEYGRRIGEDNKLKMKIYGSDDKEYHKDPDAPLDTISKSITTGAEFQIDTFYGITVGCDIHQDRFRYKDEMDAANNINKITQSNSIFLQNVLKIEFFTAILGCRHDYHSVYKGQTNPRLSLVYKIRKNLKLSLNAGRAFRAPTFGDLYSKVPGMGEGNPVLKPERAWGFDFGIEHQFADSLLSRVTLFRNDMDNFISWAPSPIPDDPYRWTPSNIGKVYSQGVEVELQNQLFKRVVQKINYTYLVSKGKITDESLNESKIKWGKKGGKDYRTLKYTPRNKFNYGISFNSDFGLGVNLNAEITDERWNLDGWDFDGKREKLLPGYGLVDVRITKKISNMELFVSIDNIFNKEYRSRWEYPLPGRLLRGGIRLAF